MGPGPVIRQLNIGIESTKAAKKVNDKARVDHKVLDNMKAMYKAAEALLKDAKAKFDVLASKKLQKQKALIDSVTKRLDEVRARVGEQIALAKSDSDAAHQAQVDSVHIDTFDLKMEAANKAFVSAHATKAYAKGLSNRMDKAWTRFDDLSLCLTGNHSKHYYQELAKQKAAEAAAMAGNKSSNANEEVDVDWSTPKLDALEANMTMANEEASEARAEATAKDPLEDALNATAAVNGTNATDLDLAAIIANDTIAAEQEIADMDSSANITLNVSQLAGDGMGNHSNVTNATVSRLTPKANLTEENGPNITAAPTGNSDAEELTSIAEKLSMLNPESEHIDRMVNISERMIPRASPTPIAGDMEDGPELRSVANALLKFAKVAKN
jgi:hypothetical protein